MNKLKKDISNILNIPDLVGCWDFNAAHPYVSRGENSFELLEGNGKPEIKKEGIIGSNSIEFKEGQYLYIPREKCEALNIHGSEAQVTILAWVKRQKKSHDQCEAVAGIWNETNRKRQFCLFLNLQIYESGNQVCGHISSVGGPTPGQRWCMDASIGKTNVNFGEWTFVGFTYDGKKIKSYINGEFDERTDRNPYSYESGIYDGGVDGSDFTVAAVHRSSEMGNYFVGQMSGLAVFNRALTAGEIKKLHKDFPLKP